MKLMRFESCQKKPCATFKSPVISLSELLFKSYGQSRSLKKLLARLYSALWRLYANHCCDLDQTPGNDLLHCIQASVSALGCQDWSRPLCLPLTCIHFLEHKSSSTCLIFNNYCRFHLIIPAFLSSQRMTWSAFLRIQMSKNKSSLIRNLVCHNPFFPIQIILNDIKAQVSMSYWC